MKVLIADDELMARKRLHRLLQPMEVEVVGECKDGTEVLQRLAGVDVVLLDIHMPNLTGVDALGLIGEDGPIVIFTTAHADYAVQAFEGGAVDYLLKPIDAGRLKKALDRARERLEGRGQGGGTGLEDRLPVPTRKGVVLVDVHTISHALIDGSSVLITTEETTYVTDFRLSDLEKRLPEGRFERLHRQSLISVAHLDRLEPVDSGGYIAHMKDGSQVPVSRQAARRLRKDWDLPR